MREGKLFLVLLGVSAALHGGFLYYTEAPSTIPEQISETVFEIDLTPPAPEVLEPVDIPEEQVPEERVEEIEPTPEIPQEVETPEVPTDFEPFSDPIPEDVVSSAPPVAPVQTPTPQATNPTILMEYRDVLHAWLTRHKRYPRMAERRGLEGEPILRLRIGPGGEVLEASIESTSGYKMLDRAAMDMVERAKPFPAFPEHVTESSLEYLIPITFALQ